MAMPSGLQEIAWSLPTRRMGLDFDPPLICNSLVLRYPCHQMTRQSDSQKHIVVDL
jgi:hypothetical protein